MDFAAWTARAQSFDHEGLSQSYTDVGSGPVIVLLHGYPTWSYDWADVIPALARDHRVIAADWIGYGLSDKPGRHVTIGEQIDRLTSLLDHLGIGDLHLVAHDYGSTCAQEWLDRPELASRTQSVTLMNGGLVYDAYRPTRTQRLLLTPLGPLVARMLSPDRLRAKLDALRGVKLSDTQFDAVLRGARHQNGLRKFHILQRYITERANHHPRWDAALAAYPGPVQLIWGPLDPISGLHVLAPLRRALPNAKVTELPGIGHFVPDEAPDAAAQAILEFTA